MCLRGRVQPLLPALKADLITAPLTSSECVCVSVNHTPLHSLPLVSKPICHRQLETNQSLALALTLTPLCGSFSTSHSFLSFSLPLLSVFIDAVAHCHSTDGEF